MLEDTLLTAAEARTTHRSSTCRWLGGAFTVYVFLAEVFQVT